MIKEKDLIHDDSLLFITPVEDLRTNFIRLINQTNKKEYCRIVINVNIPYEKIKIKIKDEPFLFFIDCITKYVEVIHMRDSEYTTKKIHYLGHPANIKRIQHLIEKIFKPYEKKQKILIIESLSTFAIYNQIHDLIVFLRYFITHISKLKLLAITPDEKDRFVIDNLGPLFDSIIKV